MDNGSVVTRLGNMKALLGIIAGAGASYGLYKLISGQRFKKNRKSTPSESPGAKSVQLSEVKLQPGSLLARVSGLDVICPRSGDGESGKYQRSLFANLIREMEGIHIIAHFLSDPAADVRVCTLNALNNLCMNVQNQEQIKLYAPQVLELIEMSPVNSDLQLSALRLLTNLSVTDEHQHLLKESVTLFLSLLVVSQKVKWDNFVQISNQKLFIFPQFNLCFLVQAPASVLLLFDERTAPAVLLRLLTFVGNLKAWRPSAQVADELRRKQDSLFRVMLDESSQLHSKLVQLLSHPDGEIQAQVARILT
uniref:Armadillo repeat containing 10 n=1 Tax=Kryptolebias marmoratus TaxID=37003 RepID=A0A3Q3F362_KRYMA